MKAMARLRKEDEKKHSIRYNAIREDDARVVTSIYVMKSAFQNSQYPSIIKVTIEEEN